MKWTSLESLLSNISDITRNNTEPETKNVQSLVSNSYQLLTKQHKRKMTQDFGIITLTHQTTTLKETNMYKVLYHILHIPGNDDAQTQNMQW